MVPVNWNEPGTTPRGSLGIWHHPCPAPLRRNAFPKTVLLSPSSPPHPLRWALQAEPLGKEGPVAGAALLSGTHQTYL